MSLAHSFIFPARGILAVIFPARGILAVIFPARGILAVIFPARGMLAVIFPARGILAVRPFMKYDYVVYYHGILKTDRRDPGEWDEYWFEIHPGTRNSQSFW